MFGLLLIDKRGGVTSHDVVYRARRRLGIKKIGHAGTLDPLATGLLVLAVGPATRFLRYIDLEPKEYVFTVSFGRSTATYDADGETVTEAPVPDDLAARVKDSLIHFVGEIEQLPPMYSAVKKDGKKLYQYAREGEEVERELRAVTVLTLETTGPRTNDQIAFRCVCSGGTYVRTLAHDLGQKIGCPAHVSALRRTRVGRFSVDEAIDVDGATEGDLIPMAEALEPMPSMTLNEGQANVIEHGNFLRVDHLPNGPFVALIHSGEVLSVARVEGNELRPECVVAVEARSGAV